jgi:hypothetical protein
MEYSDKKICYGCYSGWHCMGKHQGCECKCEDRRFGVKTPNEWAKDEGKRVPHRWPRLSKHLARVK